MKNNLIGKIVLSGLTVSVILSGCNSGKSDIVKENFDFAGKQLAFALEEIQKAKESIESKAEREKNNWGPLTNPRSLESDGSLIVVPSKDWTSGFFPGELWFMYEYTKDNTWKQAAHDRTVLLEREQWNGGTHDMGFKMYCSYGNAYRLTGDTLYRNVLIQSAKTLATRYSPVVGAIRSWDFDKVRRESPDEDGWSFPVIIDNMLNLELLFWAAKETGDSTYYNMAVSHAEKTMNNHFRQDFGSYHVVDYDAETGAVRQKNTHQGYKHESTWSRGEAWGIYGFTMCYRETGKPEFLEHAKKIATFIFTNPNLPTDLIPYWDYNAPNIPNEPRDVSAATCTASALYELALFDKENADVHRKHADQILENITRSYRATLYSHHGFLLLHSTGCKPLDFEIDQPLVYADYYFLEALLRKNTINVK